jgi:hypothetical protein
VEGAYFFDVIPIALVFGLSVLIALLSVELGYRLGQRTQRATPGAEPPIGSSVGATLGLLAFTLAFTFGMAAQRYDTRGQLVVDEADAVRTAYLHAALFDEPDASALRRLLREYVDVRLEPVGHPELLPRAKTRSEELHQLLWSQVTAAASRLPNSHAADLNLDAVTSVIRLHFDRAAAIRNRIPAPIWFFMVLVTILGMSSMGYYTGLSRSARTAAILFLTFAFSGVITLIATLDRPQQGFIRVSQQPLEELKRSMSAGAFPSHDPPS